jgi:antitoxin ParD1/3/4
MTKSYRKVVCVSRSSRPISVTLGELQKHVEARVRSGAYSSASEVLRAALRALDREETAVTEWLRAAIADAFTDTRPNIPARKVFKKLRQHHTRRIKARRNEEV